MGKFLVFYKERRIWIVILLVVVVGIVIALIIRGGMRESETDLVRDLIHVFKMNKHLYIQVVENAKKQFENSNSSGFDIPGKMSKLSLKGLVFHNKNGSLHCFLFLRKSFLNYKAGILYSQNGENPFEFDGFQSESKCIESNWYAVIYY